MQVTRRRSKCRGKPSRTLDGVGWFSLAHVEICTLELTLLYSDVCLFWARFCIASIRSPYLSIYNIYYIYYIYIYILYIIYIYIALHCEVQCDTMKYTHTHTHTHTHRFRKDCQSSIDAAFLISSFLVSLNMLLSNSRSGKNASKSWNNRTLLTRQGNDL